LTYVWVKALASALLPIISNGNQAPSSSVFSIRVYLLLKNNFYFLNIYIIILANFERKYYQMVYEKQQKRKMFLPSFFSVFVITCFQSGVRHPHQISIRIHKVKNPLRKQKRRFSLLREHGVFA
jgi:hypothetical protein